ncbi:MAG: glycoside hydrolase family 28 protein [Sphingobacteriales bacterium]|uniref:glycoside hydrolase family 28 protein n=1 Tax=Hydrotalea flava TaxID=714549 RepID=UPI000AF5DF6A|nr:glycoside hydrolase family 28 protein [Hydrotalea flava]RTL47507.1 MAG: glycoside hydrolase family 28 protein [Sphingobacteriales bacterium]
MKTTIFFHSFSIQYRLLLMVVICSLSVVTRVVAQDKTMDDYRKMAPFAMPELVLPAIPVNTFTITDFGAIGNGQALNTNAIQHAIEACSKAGGGTVLIPSGLWLTGPITLKSNINLHVSTGAVVLFTPDRNSYPIIPASKNTTKNFIVQPPIYGYQLKNVAITGGGILDGSGEAWRPVKKSKVSEIQWKHFLSVGGVLNKDGQIWRPSEAAMNGEKYLKSIRKKEALTADDFLPARDFIRPKMVVLVDCDKVLIDGPTFKNAPNFVMNPQHCTNLVIRNVQVNNEYWAQNGDGIDISSCKNVMIYKCTVTAGDDGICMKSSGEKIPGVPELANVIMADCIVYHAHGGFVIGSNTDGGMQNIFVNNCSFIGTDMGVRVKSNAGRGGTVKDIYVQNIYMANIVNEAIGFDTYYEDMPAGKEKSTLHEQSMDKVPNFSNFYFQNIYCNGAAKAISIKGMPDALIRQLHFKDMVIAAKSGFACENATDLFLKNVHIVTGKQPLFETNGCKNIQITE